MTLNRNISCRQAEEAAGTRQQFETPQAELAWLKENRQDLKGFVRVLEIIEAAQQSDDPFIAIDQVAGWLDRSWIDRHRPDCAICVGGLLHWFFGPAAGVPRDPDYVEGRDSHGWDYECGVPLFDEYLGADSGLALQAIVYELSGIEDWEPDPRFTGTNSMAFDGETWPVGHLEVFRELARQFPHK